MSGNAPDFSGFSIQELKDIANNKQLPEAHRKAAFEELDKKGESASMPAVDKIKNSTQNNYSEDQNKIKKNRELSNRKYRSKTEKQLKGYGVFVAVFSLYFLTQNIGQMLNNISLILYMWPVIIFYIINVSGIYFLYKNPVKSVRFFQAGQIPLLVSFIIGGWTYSFEAGYNIILGYSTISKLEFGLSFFDATFELTYSPMLTENFTFTLNLVALAIIFWLNGVRQILGKIKKDEAPTNM